MDPRRSRHRRRWRRRHHLPSTPALLCWAAVVALSPSHGRAATAAVVGDAGAARPPAPGAHATTASPKPTHSAVGLHECVRSYLPPATFPAPSKAAVADLTAHVDHILTTHAHVSEVAQARCDDVRDLIFAPFSGFGDRVRGMVTTFYMALLTHSGFAMAWHEPFALADYYAVRDLSRGGAGGRGRQSGGVTDGGGPSTTDLTGLPRISAKTIDNYFADGHDVRVDLPANSSVVIACNAIEWLELVRHPALRPVAAWYGLAGLTKAELFRLAVAVIMPRPREAVLQAVDALLAGVDADAGSELAGASNHPSPLPSRSRHRRHRWTHAAIAAKDAPAPPHSVHLVGVQIRTGGHGVTWSDPPRHPVASAACHAAAAVQACSQHRACAIAVTSDSELATALFRAEVARLQQAVEEEGHAGSGFGNTTERPSSGAHTSRRPTITVVEMDGPILHTRGGLSAGSGGVLPAGGGAGGGGSVQTKPGSPGSIGAGRAGHAPPATPASSDPWLKTMVDWTLLSQADALLLSYSGFGWTAAWAGGVRNIRQLIKNTREPECTWFDMPALLCTDGFYVRDIRCPYPK